MSKQKITKHEEFMTFLDTEIKPSQTAIKNLFYVLEELVKAFDLHSMYDEWQHLEGISFCFKKVYERIKSLMEHIILKFENNKNLCEETYKEINEDDGEYDDN